MYLICLQEEAQWDVLKPAVLKHFGYLINALFLVQDTDIVKRDLSPHEIYRSKYCIKPTCLEKSASCTLTSRYSFSFQQTGIPWDMDCYMPNVPEIRQIFPFPCSGSLLMESNDRRMNVSCIKSRHCNCPLNGG